MEHNLLLFTLCVVPSLILMWYIYIKDKVEKEPLFLLILLFAGGIISAIISSSISITLKMYIPFLNYQYSDMNIFQILIKSFIVIAVIEETSKWIIGFICTWRNKNFNHIFDPIVYSVFISLGFATFENLLYGYTYSSYGFMPILLRGIISVPCHAAFGVFMGYYLGIAKNSQASDKNNKKTKYIFFSIVFPIIFHFIYDILLINPNKLSYAIFVIYVTLLYCLTYLKINKFNSKKKLIPKKEI